ncbi:hypothetical protein HK096_008852 [Nowakowskiella sp. JEL0078]|nr:hypothetical protein HK096_008852 [Nowakowskiella sp. JEL0078]
MCNLGTCSTFNTFLGSNANWTIFKEFHEFLSPFKSATLVVSVEIHPTLSTVIPLYNTLLDCTEQVIYNSCGDVKDAALACKSKLTTYFDVTSEACTVATVLDLQFCLAYYKTDLAGMDPNEVFNTVNEKYLADYAPKSGSVGSVSSAYLLSEEQSLLFQPVKIDPTSELMDYCNEQWSNPWSGGNHREELIQILHTWQETIPKCFNQLQVFGK